MIIALDGPAGSGKSTTARRVAALLGYLYLDTGAMYRALALAFLRRGASTDEESVRRVLAEEELSVSLVDGVQHVWLGSEDVSEAIREPEVSDASSRISAVPAVRAFLVAEQRRIAGVALSSGGGVVMEGRDIGTVVFPDARLKVYLTADPMVRAGRRAVEYAARGKSVDEAALRDEMAERDARDSDRDHAPLKPADDAVMLDTTHLSFDEQVDFIVRLARERGA